MVTGPGDRPIRKARRVPPTPKPAPVPSRPLVLAPKPHPGGVFKQPAPRQNRTFPATPKPQPVRARRGPSQADIAHAKQLAAEIEAKARKAPPLQVKTHLGGSLLGEAAAVAPNVAIGALAGMPIATVNALTKSGVTKTVGKVASNTPKDAAELVASTPTSTYMLGKTLVTHPLKVPGMLAQSYKDFAKDPYGFATNHPVTTALMFAPAAKVPGGIAGRALRLTGKQTLRGELRTLPGTALKQETKLSKDAIVNAVQKRKQAANPTPTISPAEIRQRVDMHYEYGRKQLRRVEASKIRAIKPDKKALPKDQQAAFQAEQVKGALGGGRIHNDRTFVKQFGSTWHLAQSTDGRTMLVKPKTAVEGHIHTTRADAELVAKRLAKAGHGEFVVKRVSDKEFGVVPKVAADQLRHHAAVGSGRATYAKVLRVSRQKFTNAVLPLSPKWLTGQVVEGTVRANVHNGGPIGVATGLLRERKVFNALEAQRPGAGKEFRQRALPLGHYGGQVQEFRSTPLHHIFNESDGKIGDWLAKAGRAGEKTPGAKQVVHGWNRYTRAVFDTVNARGIENWQQRAILGRSIKDSHLMERRLIGLSQKAAQEAADGLRGTHTQVEFGRAVERAYGKYSNFTPSQRERNLHWTPFLPWYGSAVKFLTQVLPHDHPVLTAALAAANKSTQKEREKLGLSMYGPNHKPLFMMGGIPVKGGRVIRLGHYSPFALGENNVAPSAADLVLPQFSGAYKNLIGIDWKGSPLQKGFGFNAKKLSDPATIRRALATEIQSLVPGAGQAARISGLEDRLSGKKPTKTSLLGAINKEFNPVRPTGGTKKSPTGTGVKTTTVKIKPIKIKAVKIKPVKLR